MLSLASAKALRGGLPGAAAMGIQVATLLWLRTTMNYQYRHGLSTRQALRTLYAEGGVRRFYRGFAPALVQAPLSRFGDTAANAGVIALLDSASETTANLPVVAKTSAASAAAAGFRIFLMPVGALAVSLCCAGWGLARCRWGVFFAWPTPPSLSVSPSQVCSSRLSFLLYRAAVF